MKKKNTFNDFSGIMFSTDPDFVFETQQDEEQVALPNSQQDLRVQLDRKNRGGKTVTLVTGFIGTAADLEKLTKTLKTKCGVGGSAKDDEIILQGDFKEKVFLFLQKEGYKVKKAGG